MAGMNADRGARLFVTIWAAARRSVRLVEQRMREEGVDDHELALVFELALADTPLSTTAVAERMGVPFMTASDALARLVARGTVRQQPNPADRRSSLFALTAQGEEQARRAVAIVAPLTDDLADSAGLTADELQALATELNRVLTPGAESPL
jgi:DNA-binding MarR family transcriptional regulator